jgi:UDP-N-acetylmuramate dehydrogenase
LAAKIKGCGLLREAEPMSAHTSFRIGGPADMFLVPSGEGEAARARAEARAAGVPVFLLGGGTNILVSDRGIPGLVIDMGSLAGIEECPGGVAARAGTPISDVSAFALSRGLSGLEFCFSLPGSVGGAAWMNARCYEREMADVLSFVEVMEPGGSAARRLPILGAEWGYKRSPLQDGGSLILRAGFRLGPGDPAGMGKQMESYRADREAKGHFLFPCAGSVFKNDRSFGAPTGKLIESLGLKGRTVGGARIAPFHGNIIVNLGGATAADVLALIELAEEQVAARLGVRLQREVLLVGDWGEGSSSPPSPAAG